MNTSILSNEFFALNVQNKSFPSNSRNLPDHFPVNTGELFSENTIYNLWTVDVIGHKLLSEMYESNAMIASINWTNDAIVEHNKSISKLTKVKNYDPEYINLELQKKENKNAITLLESWLADDSGYDEAVWANLKRSIEENRLSVRKKFHE